MYQKGNLRNLLVAMRQNQRKILNRFREIAGGFAISRTGITLPPLDLRHAAVHEQFGSSDVAASSDVEKHDGFCNLIRAAHPAERNVVDHEFLAFVAGAG